MILVIFPIAVNNGKYVNIYYNEKKISAEIVFGLLPNCIVNLYCKRESWKNCRKKKFVLQYHFFFLYCREEGLRIGNCIAIQQIILQGCVVGWKESVLQEVLDCIVA